MGEEGWKITQNSGLQDWGQGAVLILGSVSIQTSFGWAGGTEFSQEIPIISTKQPSSLPGTLWVSTVLAWWQGQQGKGRTLFWSPLLFVMNSFLTSKHELLNRELLGSLDQGFGLDVWCEVTSFLMSTKICQEIYQDAVPQIFIVKENHSGEN